MRTSVRDLIITGWALIFAVTVGIFFFHPSFTGEDITIVLRLIGFALIPTITGVGLMRFTEIVGRSSGFFRKFVLALFIIGMLPLIPVVLETFSMPWAGLIVITLVYVRWRWAVVPSTD
jgi:hypothetical protein